MTLSIIKKVAVEVLDNTPNKPFLCLPMSAVFYAVLKDSYKLNPKLVTGDLYYQDQCIFKQEFSINDGDHSSFKLWDGHAWVVIDDMICDLSFFRTLHSDKFNRPTKKNILQTFGEGRGALLIPKANNEIGGLRYFEKEILRDDIATGIIQGAEQLFKK